MYTLALILMMFGTLPPQVAAITERDALILRVTQSDLNAVLRDVSATHGWQRFGGKRARSSRGVHDLRYDVTLSPPQVTLDGDTGEISLGFGILEAELNVGRIEHRSLSCENVGLRVDPRHPVDIDVTFGLGISDGGLQLRLDAVNVAAGKRKFRLVKPTRCSGSILPRTVAWWLGKPYLRRRISHLDEILFARIESFAGEIEQRRGVLRSSWELSGGTLEVNVSRFDVGVDALSLALDVSGANGRDDQRPWVEAPLIRAAGSHLALSESVLNAVLSANMPGRQRPARPASGNMRALLLSDSIYTLIPGLRDVPDRERLLFRTRVDAPLRVRLTPHVDPLEPTRRARIGFAMGPLAIEILDTDGTRLLGELRIVSGQLDVVPYVNTIGGLSFETVRNEWHVEARGIEHNDDLIAGILQELVFGALFETQYEPLLRDGVTLGETRFLPTAFRVENGYLVVDLVAGAALASPPASASLSFHANR